MRLTIEGINSKTEQSIRSNVSSNAAKSVAIFTFQICSSENGRLKVLSQEEYRSHPSVTDRIQNMTKPAKIFLGFYF
jgi:hypothetical protein